MYKVKNKSACPHKGFQWDDPSTGYQISARNYPNFIDQIVKHRVANSLVIPSNEEIEHAFCQKLDPKIRQETCQEYDENGPKKRRGPGSILKSSLRALGIDACMSCLDLAAKMDAWGPDGCEVPENFAYIVSVIRANAERKKWFRVLPFKEMGIEKSVQAAIFACRIQR